MTTFIKYFFMILCSFYFYAKLLNLKLSKKILLIDIFISIILSITVYIINQYAPYLVVSTIIFGIIITVYFIYNISFNIIIFTSILSFGFSYFTFFISTILLAPFAFILVLNNQDGELSYLFTHTLLGIVQLLITKSIFSIKRLKNGMPFLYNKTFNTISIFFSAIIIIPTTFYSVYKDNNSIFIALILLTGIYGFILYIWWKNQLTKNYRDKLKSKEIQELHNEIERLKKDNENLSKIVHKDNKLIPAMVMSVKELLTSVSSYDNINECTDIANQLLETLNTLSNERAGIMNLHEKQIETIPSSGIYRIDTLIKYMKQKAFNHNINFSFTLNSNIKFLTQNIINEDDLCTILADLIENAIIATKEQNTKQVLLNIDIEHNHYCIHLLDSGIPFESTTILNLGIIRTTTHSSTGGSGIGLMNTFELLKKYNASFVITESPDTTIFTKTISIYFDNLNQFKVISNRPEIVILSTQRNDIIIEKAQNKIGLSL